MTKRFLPDAVSENDTGHGRKPPRALQKTAQGTAKNPHRALQKTTQGTAEKHPGHCRKTTQGTAKNPTQGTAKSHHKVMLVTATMRTFSDHRIWTPPPWFACFRTRMHRCKTARIKSAKLCGHGTRLRGHRFQSPAGECSSSPGCSYFGICSAPVLPQ